MADEQSTSPTDPSTGGQTDGQTPPVPHAEFTPIQSQEDLNKVIAARLDRERAKFADYADLKAKAEQLDKIEESNKTEAERTADRIKQLEEQSATARVSAFRDAAVKFGGIAQEDAELFLTGTDEETLTRQLERLAARLDEAGRPRPPKPDPTQGRSTSGPVNPADQFAAAISGALKR